MRATPFVRRTVRLVACLFLAGQSTAPLAAQEETPIPPAVGERARPVEVYAADAFFEGPTWDPASAKLYFTSFVGAKTQILRLDAPGKASLWLDKTEGANGTYLGRDGRLLAAQAFGHRIMSYAIGPEGPTDAKVLAADARWFQPNDLCQTPNGDIYFTDPDFAGRKLSAIYRLTADGKVAKVASNMPVPNGIVPSVDGKTLFVSDSHEKRWRRYTIRDDGTLDEGQILFDPKTKETQEPDGMSVDADGNVYVTGRGGIWVVTPVGKSLGHIPIREFCTNVTFGGADGKTLYITCDKKVYSLQMTVAGAQFKAQPAKR